MIKDKEKSGKVVFKDYPQHQVLLLPPSLEELIGEKHLVQVINSVIERIDLKILEQGYEVVLLSQNRSGSGTEYSFYVVVSHATSDFSTINNFRSGTLKSLIEKSLQRCRIFS